jgi:hypothetical protein
MTIPKNINPIDQCCYGKESKSLPEALLSKLSLFEIATWQIRRTKSCSGIHKMLNHKYIIFFLSKNLMRIMSRTVGLSSNVLNLRNVYLPRLKFFIGTIHTLVVLVLNFLDKQHAIVYNRYARN